MADDEEALPGYMLGLSEKQMVAEVGMRREAFKKKLRDAALTENQINEVSEVDMNNISALHAQKMLIDRQARLFMFRHDQDAECRFDDAGVIIAGFVDPTTDMLFRVSR